MKSTEEYLSEVLSKEVEVITASELRFHLGDCLTQASMGKTFCIKRKGKIMGFLTPTADILHVVKPDGSCDTLPMPPHKNS